MQQYFLKATCFYNAFNMFIICSSSSVKWKKIKEEDEEREDKADEEEAKISWSVCQFNVRASVCSDQSHHMERAWLYVYLSFSSTMSVWLH